MPVRSLNSSVFKWPNASRVDRAVRSWAQRVGRGRKDVLRIGYFGSYARGDWGVGSDLDLVIIVERSELPFERRSVAWDTGELPVPTDVLVYTAEEWEALTEREPFGRRVRDEVVWVYIRAGSPETVPNPS